jgi:hypothetical protein
MVDEIKKNYSPMTELSHLHLNVAQLIFGWPPFKILSVSTVLYPIWPPLLKIEISHYAYTVQIWALSGLKSSSFGHLKKFRFLVMAAILDTRRC